MVYLVHDCDAVGLCGIPAMAQLGKILGRPSVSSSFRFYPELWAKIRSYIKIALDQTVEVLRAIEENQIADYGPALVAENRL